MADGIIPNTEAARRGGREGRQRIVGWRASDLTRIPAAAPEHGEASRHVLQLRAALRRERMRGRTGDWTYDLTRHLSLARQLRQAEATMELASPADGAAKSPRAAAGASARP